MNNLSKIVSTASRNFIFNEENGLLTAYSAVYKGHDELFNRKVAVKVVAFDPELSPKELTAQLNRAQSELTALSRIGDMTVRVPYLIDKHYDEKDKKLYIFMQWVNGDTLRKKFEENAIRTPSEFVQWMIDLADVLALMEKDEFYHNDIKPENIMIDKSGQLHLIDFNLTLSDKTMHEGTPGYIAPELTEHIEARKDKADMFAIGVMFYEYFTGVLPTVGTHYGMKGGFFFNSDKASEWDLFVEPKKVNKKLPSTINKLIIKLMKRCPSHRFSDYGALKRELLQIKKDLRK